MKRFTPYILLVLLAACTTKAPTSFTDSGNITIIPDYTEITVPSNIAPLNFNIDITADKYVTTISNGEYQICIGGKEVRIPEKKWQKFLLSGKNVSVQIFTKDGDKWSRHKSFNWNFAEEIDPYISYRIIPPSVESYERLSINQRNVTNFEENVIYANSMVQTNENGQCINCHHFSNYGTDRMMFHARQYLGGTIITNGKDIKRINLKTDSTISAGVYPAWHPEQKYIAFSTNTTKQSIHTSHSNKIEVFDIASDLILYNIDRNEVSIIENDSSKFECFPAWAPDGKTLYYVAATVEYPANASREAYIMHNYEDVHYNLYKKSFNPQTEQWGDAECIYDAASEEKSITLPRVSPDGRYLMFTMGNFGVFHIWHKDANLFIMDLKNREIRELTEINSNEVESYHSWSSNGKWIVFSTRREDGGFTRLYLSHFNEDGTFSKPFALPQLNAAHNSSFMYSYNIPEFTTESVKITPKEFASFFKSSETIQAKFKSNKN